MKEILSATGDLAVSGILKILAGTLQKNAPVEGVVILDVLFKIPQWTLPKLILAMKELSQLPANRKEIMWLETLKVLDEALSGINEDRGKVGTAVLETLSKVQKWELSNLALALEYFSSLPKEEREIARAKIYEGLGVIVL